MRSIKFARLKIFLWEIEPRILPQYVEGIVMPQGQVIGYPFPRVFEMPSLNRGDDAYSIRGRDLSNVLNERDEQQLHLKGRKTQSPPPAPEKPKI